MTTMQGQSPLSRHHLLLYPACITTAAMAPLLSASTTSSLSAGTGVEVGVGGDSSPLAMSSSAMADDDDNDNNNSSARGVASPALSRPSRTDVLHLPLDGHPLLPPCPPRADRPGPQ